MASGNTDLQLTFCLLMYLGSTAAWSLHPQMRDDVPSARLSEHPPRPFPTYLLSNSELGDKIKKCPVAAWLLELYLDLLGTYNKVSLDIMSQALEKENNLKKTSHNLGKGISS